MKSNSPFPPLDRRRFMRVSAVICLLVGLLWTTHLRAQTAEEHASHHPDQAGASPAAADAGAPSADPAAAPALGGMPAADGNPAPAAGMPTGEKPAGGGMMEGMGEMMKNMGKPPPKELYPSLMVLPELTPEKRREIEQQAAERMKAGAAIIGQSLETLNNGAQSGDYARMQDAAVHLREGIGQLESGVAARRALAEGRAPREVALAWFKREMNISLGTIPAPHGLLGVTPFHLFTMALLVAFAVAMLTMYFFKMRRAAALFGRIEADKGSPPPGAAPELAGGKPPSGDNRLAAADKPAAPADKPAADAPPTAP